MRTFEHYLNGRFEKAQATFASINPADGKPWALMPKATAPDVDRAVKAAKAAFNGNEWQSLNATQRGQLLFKLADLIEQHTSVLAELESQDTGKIIRETSAQIAYVAQYYRYYGGLADKIEGAYLPIDKADMEVWIRRQPVGVVAAFVPWNSQLFLSAVKIAPAVAAGATIVLKASEEGPAPLLELARLIDQAGFPAGVINIITGFADCGQALSAHPEIDHLAFTGGHQTARHIVRNTAENLASTTLELGGKSPFVVFADANIDSAVNAQIAAIFAASGQSCVAGSRLIISADIKDEFLKRLLKKVDQITIGDPLDMASEMGPLCTQKQCDYIDEIVTESINQGAILLSGGKRIDKEGFYYPPTIIDCSEVTNAPALAQELFGPVLSVCSFNTEAEAIALANDSQYGLACGIFSQNLTQAHRVAKAIRAGVVWLNTYRVVSPIAPFGGFGLSGHGREGGIESVLAYTQMKTVWLRTSDEPIPDPFTMR